MKSGPKSTFTLKYSLNVSPVAGTEPGFGQGGGGAVSEAETVLGGGGEEV